MRCAITSILFMARPLHVKNKLLVGNWIQKIADRVENAEQTTTSVSKMQERARAGLRKTRKQQQPAAKVRVNKWANNRVQLCGDEPRTAFTDV